MKITLTDRVPMRRFKYINQWTHKKTGRVYVRFRRPGSYLLLLGKEIVYVGSSLDMPERVKGHRSNGRPFDKAFYIPASGDDRTTLEKILIKAINPTHNRQGKWPPVLQTDLQTKS